MSTETGGTVAHETEPAKSGEAVVGDDDVGATLALLADEEARALFRHTGKPKTIPELTADCGVARSTAYRKVRKLTAAGLLEPASADDDPNTATAYQRTVDALEIIVGEAETIEVRR
ncbi:HTH domain protein [Natronomonas pharaonis DSM 2160]|uniref:HTH domain protein n=1 Tax=Natronomonas pharaonis (strain ATCC 35678 / DSM 2160 / CIP 103997 / JCM 8858 / NBRC 14720 / NCIMB 2260 / Gabara) TaxID=348780 RepID=A0A1U7ETE3_NATPD|nr:helix-turn-helix domain-containing protein [Natronomonas pharaonis]CAI48158.1 HTH domain protein [Natronomonas pharaonis DSM 2160]